MNTSVASVASMTFASTGDPLKDACAVKIAAWLSEYLAHILEVPAHEIDQSEQFDRHGLDSSAAVGLAGDLGDWLGCDIDPTLTYDFPTIAAVSVELAGRTEIRRALQAK